MSETLFTEKQIQDVICLLCKATWGHNTCILSDFDRSQIDDSKLFCTVTSEFGTFDKNSEEVLAICEWLNTDNKVLFFKGENYYLKFKNAPP